MWVLGLALFCLFYWIVFRWYLPLLRSTDLKRPKIWFQGRFHTLFWLISLSMLIGSSIAFYQSDELLSLLPVVFFLIAAVLFVRKMRERIDQAIAAAVSIQVLLERAGECRSTINRSIYAKLLDKGPPDEWVCADWDTKSLLKFCILPDLGLYDPEKDMETWASHPEKPSESDKIDELVDHCYQLLSKKA